MSDDPTSYESLIEAHKAFVPPPMTIGGLQTVGQTLVMCDICASLMLRDAWDSHTAYHEMVFNQLTAGERISRSLGEVVAAHTDALTAIRDIVIP